MESQYECRRCYILVVVLIMDASSSAVAFCHLLGSAFNACHGKSGINHRSISVGSSFDNFENFCSPRNCLRELECRKISIRPLALAGCGPRNGIWLLPQVSRVLGQKMTVLWTRVGFCITPVTVGCTVPEYDDETRRMWDHGCCYMYPE